jgi:anti-sigma regulatory factor (Ser/Thr protein kinase)
MQAMSRTLSRWLALAASAPAMASFRRSALRVGYRYPEEPRNPMAAPGQRSAEFDLDPEPVQVGRARAQVRQTLRGWGLGEHTDLAELIVSELVTNAIVHGTGPIRVTLSVADDELQFGVRDEGGGRPVRRQPGPADERGRGLEVIDSLLALHGRVRGVAADRRGPGKTVFVRISLAATTRCFGPALTSPAVSGTAGPWPGRNA